MFWIIDSFTKEVRVYYVFNDGIYKNLKKIIQNNINANENEDIDINKEFITNTCIFYDCFSSYHQILLDIKAMY